MAKRTQKKTAAQAKPTPKMVKLANGGERPETAADRHSMARMDKLQAIKPDVAKVFDIADDMENNHLSIEMLVNALFLIADGMGEHRVANALSGIANGIEHQLAEAEKKHGQIFDLTWGYRCGRTGETGKEAVS